MADNRADWEKREDREFLIRLAKFVGVMASVIALLIMLTAWADSVGCRNRWLASGMLSRWTFVGGCVVETRVGTWVPEDAYRVVERKDGAP